MFLVLCKYTIVVPLQAAHHLSKHTYYIFPMSAYIRKVQKNRNICKLKMLHAESEMRSCQKKMKLIVCSFFVNSLVALWWVSIISNSTHKAWGMKENFCDEWMNPYFVLLMLYGAVSMDGRDIRVIGLLLLPPCKYLFLLIRTLCILTSWDLWHGMM